MTDEEATTLESEEEQPEEKLIPWKQFLEEYPVNTYQKVTEYYMKTSHTQGTNLRRETPILRLWCPNENCQGIRNFAGKWERFDTISVSNEKWIWDFLTYTCRDCGERSKTFCIAARVIEGINIGEVIKIGEYPEPHINIPSGLPKLLGEDYPIFEKGLKCEKQGLGIGAFAYYRRVVDNQKGQLINRIIEVAHKLNAKPEMIGKLEKASKAKQFSRAVDTIKDAIPESLLVNGHNPLKLLYKALSIGLHEKSDEKCLEKAHIIRMVLSDLAERIQQALREQAELKRAVSDLLKVEKEAK